MKGVLKDYPKLRLTQGRKVLEIRPTIKWDKGKAIEFLLESLGYGNSKDVLPIYIGDDRTDEDAFKVPSCICLETSKCLYNVKILTDSNRNKFDI